MNYNFVLDLKCTHVSDVETITSKKNGNNYSLIKCDFSDGCNEIKGAAIFADDYGNVPHLRIGDIYRVKVSKYYDKTAKVEKEYFTLVK